jgi:hypothetical protein
MDISKKRRRKEMRRKRIRRVVGERGRRRMAFNRRQRLLQIEEKEIKNAI